MRFILFLFLTLTFVAPAGAEQALYTPEKPGASSVILGGPVINELALKDTDVTEALEIIAAKTGMNIITGQNVKGKVTVFLKRVNAREALRTVLESNNLAFMEEGGIVRVMTADEFLTRFGYAFGQEKASRLIKLNFIAPREAQALLEEMKSPLGKIVINDETKTLLIVDNTEKLAAMEAFMADIDLTVVTRTIGLTNVAPEAVMADIRRMLTQGIGSVEVDPSGKGLLVKDTAARVERIRRVMESIDARGRVIVLEAKLVHVILNNEHLEGVDWTGIVQEYQRLRLLGHYDFLSGSDATRALGFGMILNDDFPTLIEALDTVGIVQEYPLSTIRVSGDELVRIMLRLDDPSLDMSTVRLADVDESADMRPVEGASMAFTVKTAFDVTGEIVTSIVPHEAKPLTQDPALAARAAKGSVLSASEGYTAVIGGMIVSERTAAAHKIPLLGDLPLLGFAFRMEGSVTKEEFIVFLTPRAVSISEALVSDDMSGNAVVTGKE